MRFFCLLWLLFSSALALGADEVDYRKHIKPVLMERCVACHGSLQANGKLRLDAGSLILKGGTSGPGVVPKDVAKSHLFSRITEPDAESRMPPEGLALTSEQIAHFKKWIEDGATFPADDLPEADPRDHWAFQAPKKKDLPTPKQETYRVNPIDRWLATTWESQGLTSTGPIDKALLLRRLYFDLIGLPPSQGEIEAFVKDTAPDAYEKVVERLLKSPQYGERWGRHFMDVWRYSDPWGLGAEIRNSQKHIWHWRDWLIESLNEDVGYNQMVREMMAADELYPTDLKKLRASGYLVRQYFKFNRNTWLEETVEHTSKAFLGLTMNCSKCHDHKYDPISQTDYYRFRAFFEPYQVRTEMLGDTDFEKAGVPRAFDCNLDAPTYVFTRGDERQPRKDRPIAPGLPQALQIGALKIEPIALPAMAYLPHLRPEVQEAYRKSGEQQITQARERVKVALLNLAEAEQRAAKSPPPAKVEAKRPGQDIAPGALLLSDDFAKANEKLWELGPGQWKYERQRLVQAKADGAQSSIRSKENFEGDFEVKLKYVTTGGAEYQSVGFNFDTTDRNGVLVYSSAGGNKLQVAHRENGTYTYPADGAIGRGFELNQPTEMIIRVRGQLVNVSIDGKHQLAYQLPIARQKGKFELITYSASAEFINLEVRKLPEGMELVKAAKAILPAKDPGKPKTVAQAKFDLAQAEWNLKIAEQKAQAQQAAFKAEMAKHGGPDSSKKDELIRAAALGEKQVAATTAAQALGVAEYELAQATTKDAAQKKVDAAKKALENAEKTLSTPGTNYQVPRGALKTLESNVEGEASRMKPFPQGSTGRRTALANYLTDPKNPLTARVLVNHVWARHFGSPLVATMFDFGRKGAKPTHPELLDWLAVDFMEHGWQLKHLHRLMVTSQAYRRTSSAAQVLEANSKIDPDNRYLWRANSQRLEAQAIRDALLLLGGKLDTTQGGPPIDPVGQAQSLRRSLYFVHSHNDHHKFLMQFDDANVLDCYRRTQSIVPQQALTLANSKFAMEMAAAIAGTIDDSKLSDADFIVKAFRLILGTVPSSQETEACLAALGEWQAILKEQKHASPQGKARVNLVGALLNHNDFVTVR